MAAYLELPAVIRLRALEENLHSSKLLRETLGCGLRSCVGGPRRGATWRLLCDPPMLDASDGDRSNMCACM